MRRKWSEVGGEGAPGIRGLRAYASMWPRLILVAVSIAVGSLSLAGCGGGDEQATQDTETTAGTGVEEAGQLVAEEEKPVPFEAPGPSFDASQAAGKTVWYISLGFAIPFNRTVLDGVTEALDEVGVKIVPFDGKFQISEEARGFDQALAQNADLIAFQGIAPPLLGARIADAGKKNIPVVSILNGDPGIRMTGETPAVVAPGTSHCYSCAGQMMAHFAIADSGGEANAVVIWSSDLTELGNLQIFGIRNEFMRLCPDCKVRLVDVPFPQWETSLTTTTQAIIRQDPTVNYLLPLYDGMALFMIPGIHAANAADRVKIVTFNGTQSVLESIEKSDVVAADVGSAALRQGWGIADQIMRVLAGVGPVEDINVPLRLFTANNIQEIDLGSQESTWYGDVDFKAEYRKLWGINK